MVGRVGVAVLALALCAHADPFRIIDLGTIGGTESQGVDVNNSGQASADSRTSGNASWQPFLWDDGTRTTGALLPAGGRAFAFGMNDAGFMVGRQDPGGNPAFAVRWAPDGTVTELPGDEFAQAIDINNAGVAVGGSGPEPFSQKPVYWDGLTRTDLALLGGGTAGRADSINEAGWMAGWSATASVLGRAVVWMPDGTIIDISDPSWDLFSGASAINNNQQVVGDVFTATGGFAFFWENGTTTLLPKPDGMINAAFDLNDHGIAVGAIGTGFLLDRAVYWDSSHTMHELNTPELAAQGWTLNLATGINNDGWIVGHGTLNGVSRAFLLQPVPEPGSLALVAGALAGIWFLRRRSAR